MNALAIVASATLLAWPVAAAAQVKVLMSGGFSGAYEQLLPELKTLKDKPGATSRQKVVSEIMSGVDRSRIDSEKNFLDVLDKVHEISSDNVDQTHVFTLSQVYEGLLLKMGERGNDGGQFFTPREVIRAMVRVVDPQIGKTVYDPGCGTGGFLAQSYEYMRDKAGDKISTVELDTLKHRTFYGREKDNVVYPIGLANLVLHGIDDPHIWHGNSLSDIPTYAGLFDGAPKFFDYVLMNPPFGGKEGKEAQTPYEYKTGATQVLFLEILGGIVVLGIVLPPAGHTPLPPHTMGAWMYVLLLSLGSVLAANFFFFAAVRRIDAALTSSWARGRGGSA